MGDADKVVLDQGKGSEKWTPGEHDGKWPGLGTPGTGVDRERSEGRTSEPRPDEEPVLGGWGMGKCVNEVAGAAGAKALWQAGCGSRTEGCAAGLGGGTRWAELAAQGQGRLLGRPD